MRWLRSAPQTGKRTRGPGDGAEGSSPPDERDSDRGAAGWCDSRLRRRPGAADDQGRAPLPRAAAPAERDRRHPAHLPGQGLPPAEARRRARHRPHGRGRLARACTPISSRPWRSATGCWRRWWSTSTAMRRPSRPGSGSAGAGYLEATLSGGERIGVSSWSQTLLSVVDRLRPLRTSGADSRRPAGRRRGRRLGPGPGEPAARRAGHADRGQPHLRPRARAWSVARRCDGVCWPIPPWRGWRPTGRT